MDPMVLRGSNGTVGLDSSVNIQQHKTNVTAPGCDTELSPL